MLTELNPVTHMLNVDRCWNLRPNWSIRKFSAFRPNFHFHTIFLKFLLQVAKIVLHSLGNKKKKGGIILDLSIRSTNTTVKIM